MSQQGLFLFGEQAAVATSYAVGTNQIKLAKPVRTVRVVAKGSGQMVFMVVQSTQPATDLGAPASRFKLSASDPTKSGLTEYKWVLPNLADTFDFLAVGSVAEVYLTGDEMPDCD